MGRDARDMVEAVSDLLSRGYDHEYRIREGQLYDLTADKPVAAGDARVDGAMRFESAPDAGDGSNIYAIADRKGLLIYAFDALDQECSRELYEQLNANRPTRHDNGSEIASRYRYLRAASGAFTSVSFLGRICTSPHLKDVSMTQVRYTSKVRLLSWPSACRTSTGGC